MYNLHISYFTELFRIYPTRGYFKEGGFMLMSLRFLRNSLRNFVYRLRTQGWRAALIRLGGHGLPRLTGIPFVRYSRITPEIYVGAQISPVGKKQLKAWGITSSVNMRDEFDD